MERLKLFHSIKEQKIGSYALLQIENPEMTLEETDRILKNKIRENDNTGNIGGWTTLSDTVTGG